MKKSIIMIALAAMTVTACNGPAEREEQDSNSKSEEMNHEGHGNSAHGDHHDNPMDSESTTATKIEIQESDAAANILSAYLLTKDALVNDDAAKTAQGAEKLIGAIANFDLEATPVDKKQEVKNILAATKKSAEQISDNGESIENQREKFETLSGHITELITIIGADRELYQEYCPMYNNNEGASWLSDNSEIRNPYFGSKMLKCGKVQKEFSIQ